MSLSSTGLLLLLVITGLVAVLGPLLSHAILLAEHAAHLWFPFERGHLSP